MSQSDDFIDPKRRVKNKVFKYGAFTIAMSWIPIAANIFLSFIFGLKYKEWSLYMSEICVMTIILAANNIKDLTESQVLKKGQLLCNFLYTLNIVNIILSVLFFSGSTFAELSHTDYSAPKTRQMMFTVVTYILAATLGLGVQIGEALDEIKRSTEGSIEESTEEGRQANV